MPVLEARGLSKRFGALLVADNISLQLAAGARRALIGPNGAGKTTFVSMLSGALRPDAGSVHLAGEDVTGIAPHRRARRGLARTFQVNSQFGPLTVLENVFLAVSEAAGTGGGMLRAAGSQRALIAKAEALTEELDLVAERHLPVSAISYGKQRVVEIALALASRPKVLLLDEPAAGIPSAEAARVFDVLDRLPKDMAILMIEHDMAIVRRFAAEVTVLVAGAVLMSGTPAEVLSSPDVRRVYLGGAAETRGGAHAGA
jgi:ABC-type branched-subunit amino acid transport system ATPase component